jgi:hypothetical protein
MAKGRLAAELGSGFGFGVAFCLGSRRRVASGAGRALTARVTVGAATG